jgi:ABC-type bacteriocin/lantibiotic exporter with double-glycine peptidase domain
VRRNILYYLSFYKSHKRSLVLGLVLSVAQALSLFPFALIVKYLFDSVLSQGDTKMLLLGLAVAVALVVVNSLITLANRAVSLRMIKSIVCEIRERLLHKVLFLNSAYYAQEDLDRVHTQIVQDTERLDNMTASLLTQLLPGVFIVSGLSVVLMYMNVSLFFVLFLILPLLYLVGRLISKKLKKSVKQFHDDFSIFSKGISFVLNFSELIKISSAEEKEFASQKLTLKKLESSSRKVAWIASAYNTVQGNIFVVGAIVVLLFGGLQVINGDTTVGALISFYVLLNIVSSHLKTVIGAVPALIEGSASLAALMPILQNENEEASAQKTTHFQDSIHLQNIDFAYDNHLVLKNINLEIKKYKVVGIFGPSGSGKSTLIKLILGVYSAKSGQVLIDGINIKELNLFEYRKKIGVLPQEPLFFPGSIRENLMYGLEDLSDDVLIEMCKKCRIHDFISSLPQGYDSDLGNSAKKISGGQKQRIAIARALLRNPEILILDEPDNNLDEATTLEIIENIKAMKITTIVISHNSFVLPYVDQVLKL